MNTRHLHVAALAALAGSVAAAAACGAPGHARPTPPGQGRLVVSLVDAEAGPEAPAPASRVVVRVARVTAHVEVAGWRDVTPPGVSAATPLTLDLLALRPPALPVELGLAELPAGRISGLRLHLAEDGHLVVPAGGAERTPLRLAGGAGAGVEVRGPWTLPACGQLELVLASDAQGSVGAPPAAEGPAWSLRPVVRTRSAAASPVGCEARGGEASPCPGGGCAGAGPGPAGAPCAAAADCLSGACDGRRCLVGGAAAPCRAGEDCASGGCDEGRCSVPAGAGGVGGACADGGACLSSACVAGTCAPGGQGAACRAEADCAEGLACRLGACAAASPRVGARGP